MNGFWTAFLIASGAMFWAMLGLSAFAIIAGIRAAARQKSPKVGPTIGDEFEQWLKERR